MDIEKLKISHGKLLDHLTSCNYSRTYVKEIRKLLDIMFQENIRYNSYEDLWGQVIKGKEYARNTIKLKRMYLNTVRSFDEYNHLPDGRPHAKLLFSASYRNLDWSYQMLADECGRRLHLAECDNSRSTQYTTLVLFLTEIQKSVAHTLDDVTEEMVLRFFMTGRRKGSVDTQKNLRLALRKLSDVSSAIPRIISFIPKSKRGKSVYNNLRDCEIEEIKNCLCSDTDTRMTLREKAIVSLALYRGLRGCDIANLQIHDIDWDNDEIRIVQQKTGQPLRIPMSVRVGNALTGYILGERSPADGSEYVFPSKIQPGRRLSNKSVGTIVSGVFDKLGLRPGERHRGVGVFRHSLATRLLGAGTETVVISGILGHACPEAVESYIDSDIIHLRELGLSIEDYPLPKDLYI